MSNVKIEANYTTRQKITVILALSVPAMLENILQTAVGFVDTLFVAKINLNAVTAVGIANTVLAVYIAVFMALGVGTSSLIARSVGANEIEKAKSIVRQSTILSIIIGLLFGFITLFFSEPLLQLMGADLTILEEAVTYFKIVGIPSIFIALTYTFGSILRASGDTKTPLKISIWINIIHIALDYILIFGLLNIDGLGVAGAAFATVIVRIISTLALFHSIKKASISFKLFDEHSKSHLQQLIKLSTPAAIERLVMRLGQVLYFGLIVKIGADTFAAHSIAGNIETFAYMPGYGLTIAATTLVGQSIGANRIKESYQYGMLTTGIAIAFMSTIGISLFFL